ncbi:MAG TPA: S41 family peptidase, partial [Thermoanaerobaculia bacterium]|nr:S41 family peptidase [Thermoanaerobaculia bacterium]
MKRLIFLVVLMLSVSPALRAEEVLGYYRFPAIHGDSVVFSAEGDLWEVNRQGGTATRLTTHPAEETRPAISPDGRTLAFSASYEGPVEVYTMPMGGGLPVRRTFEGERASVVGWTPRGELLYASDHYSTLPGTQLVRLDLATGRRELLPLSQANDGSFTPDGKTLYFTRFAFQGSHTKRYKGGTAQNLWRYTEGEPEAVPLTADFAGTSRTPMVWNGRVYFVSDRDGTQNLWSMDEKGGDLKQHTAHRGWDVTSPALSDGRIVYQLGADLRIFDITAGQDAPLSVRLVSDFDQLREQWVKKPLDFLTSFSLSPKGDRIALTARGQVFVVPVKTGRLVEATRKPGVRYREARFLPDGRSVVALSDETGEVEIWKLPANGVGKPEQLTKDGKVLRWDAIPSPDGRWIAHDDKDLQLWLLDTKSGKQTRIATATQDGFQDVVWSPDSRWLAYSTPAPNTFNRIHLYPVETGKTVALTSDRFNSWSPAWSPDGQWIWFFSDRTLRTLVPSPWGTRQPDPFLTATDQLFGIALKKGLRSPFEKPDELHPGDKEDEEGEAASGEEKKEEKKADDKEKIPRIEIDLDGLAERLVEAPVPPGTYTDLTATPERLFWLSTEASFEPETTLLSMAFDPEKAEPKPVMQGIESYELSADGKKLLVQKGQDFFVFDAGESAPEGEGLAKAKVDLSGWTFSVNPREQWQQMFREAWRLERDYFYDIKMHGVDWPAMLEKYRPLSLRVTSRGELDDLLGQMVSELSALHTFVGGGDHRTGDERIEVASLGAVLRRDEAKGGYRIERLYRADPDLPAEAGPLTAPTVDAREGDVIESINGISTLSVPDPALLLRSQTGKQALLKIKDGKTGKSRNAVAVPVSADRAADLRYDDWELSRRRAVEESGKGEIGYVHLRAMGGEDYTSWARDFYPAFNRQGLIIDVRNNNGGSIESWILGKLLRKAWFWWQPRVGDPTSNMQYAFRGHVAVLVNETTASDGEAFAEGIKRLNLGKVFGTRTWGGEIWLTASNFLV